MADLFISMGDEDNEAELHALKALRGNLPVLGLLPARKGEAARHFHPELAPRDARPASIAQALDRFWERRDSYRHLQHHSLIGQLYDWNQIVDEILYFLSLTKDRQARSTAEDR